jgi:hypothetical protein
VEWRFVRSLMQGGRSEDIMLLRTDDGQVSGSLPIDGYANIHGRSAEEVAALILERLAGSRLLAKGRSQGQS